MNLPRIPGDFRLHTPTAERGPSPHPEYSSAVQTGVRRHREPAHRLGKTEHEGGIVNGAGRVQGTEGVLKQKDSICRDICSPCQKQKAFMIEAKYMCLKIKKWRKIGVKHTQKWGRLCVCGGREVLRALFLLSFALNLTLL